MGTKTTSHNLVLNDLVRSVRGVLSAEREPGQMVRWIGGALRPLLGHPHLLAPEQREPDPERYRQHVLHAEESGRFSIVALVWLPGQSTVVHDHVAWCAIGVHQGQEREINYEVRGEPGDRYLIPIGECTHRAGSVSVLQPPGDVHTVYNPGPDLAISIHVYGADVRKLGSSIRCRYDLPVVENPPARRYAAR
jgi:predicted metal-dependent enzyme (double-stranded beta helix superfamily)